MTTVKLLSIGFLLALAGCESKQTWQKSMNRPNRPMNGEAKKATAVLDFLRAKRYTYVTRVSAIPTAAIRRLTALEKEKHTLNLCDVESGRHINLSDVRLFENECTSKLNFALVSDSTCLISYVQGGIGRYNALYYLTYKGALRYESYSSMPDIVSIAQLDSFLQKQISVSKQPKLAEEDDYTMLTPPPPWPKKLPKAERP